jgi:release factor glutamine methyltransferase
VSRDGLASRRGVETTVYQPAEDSALLARAALSEVSSGYRVLEVGTGSGWVAARVAEETGATVVATDLNPHACRAARERSRGLGRGVGGERGERGERGEGGEAAPGDGGGEELDVASRRELDVAAKEGPERGDEGEPERGDGNGFEVVVADLVTPFADDAFDVVLFNPPYLPTDPDNEWDDWMERALSGGTSGRAVIEPFLDTVGRVLAPGGRVLLLVSSLAGYDAVVDYARERGFEAAKTVEESYPFETLTVVRLAAIDD